MEKQIASQKNRILEHLRQGHSITPLEALVRFGSLSLAQRIMDLKRDGHPIARRISKTNTGKHVAQYFINKEANVPSL
jgi:hypothetical protein